MFPFSLTLKYNPNKRNNILWYVYTNCQKSTIFFQELTQWDLVPFRLTLIWNYNENKNILQCLWINCQQTTKCFQTWGSAFNPLNVLMDTDKSNKTNTLATAFHKYAWEANTYVWFGYSPLKICNHTKGQVSGSMNSDPMNMIHTIKQSTKEVFNEELEGYLRSRKSRNRNKQDWTPKRHPLHGIPQTCKGITFICLVWIRTTENLESHPWTSFSINVVWSDQYK